MGKDPSDIRAEIEETRGRVGDEVDALSYKTDVSGRVSLLFPRGCRSGLCPFHVLLHCLDGLFRNRSACFFNALLALLDEQICDRGQHCTNNQR
jgi:hypothetical protein